jgi:hypothetical protein
MDKIGEGFDCGENPFAPIRKGITGFVDKFYTTKE